MSRSLPVRKVDLLGECNDQGLTPQEFKSTFCKRCRNHTCTNAGWAESIWAGRMSTQVERLLISPRFADPSESHPVRDIEFPLVVPSGDLWVAPEIHLAAPDQRTALTPSVDEAIRTLAETRGKPKTQPESVTTPIEGDRQVREAGAPNPATAQPRENAMPRQNPRHYTVNADPATTHERPVNTHFPEEGMMVDGSQPPPTPPPDVAPVQEDPWAPKAKPNIVPVGAKVRMGK